MTVRSRLLATALAVLAVTGIAAGGAVSPAHAAAGVSITVEGDASKVAVADPTYETKLRVTGSGFQSIKNGYGGIYVTFGWVDATWRPSQGGTTGTDYRYVPDDESNPTGFINFVAFPGSSTEYAANGGTIAADGSWSAIMTVPGARFTSLDRSGAASEVNCLEVQCGIITIGAHGNKNANNETFTPVSFRDLYTDGATPSAPAAAAPVTPAPTRTVVVEESPSALAIAPDNTANSNDQLVTVLLWVAGGVGVLAVAAVVFLVWAVLSSRKRQRLAAASSGTDAGSAS